MSYTVESELLLTDFLDTLPDAVVWAKPVWEADKEGNKKITDFILHYTNASTEKMLGYAQGFMAGKYLVKDTLPGPEAKEEVFLQYLKVYETGQPQEFTYYYSKTDITVDVLRKKFHDGVINITRDRKGQREAEHFAQKQTNFLNELVNHSQNGILVYQAVRDTKNQIVDFRYLMSNEPARELTGFDEAFLRTTSYKDVSKLRNTEAYFDNYKKVVDEGLPYNRERYMSGVNCWFFVSTVKLDDGFLTTFIDITRLKEYQQELEISASRLTTIINASQVGIFTLDPVKDDKGEIEDFRFGIVNPWVATYIGQKAETLTGSLGSTWFPGYKIGLFNVYVDTYLHNKTNQLDYHYNHDGYDFYFNIMCTKIGNEVLVIFTDQTSIKRLQLQLESSVEQLKNSNQSLKEFAYAASHDLQEPLRKIFTFSDRLKSRYAPMLEADGIALFERIQAAAMRMRMLIDDLLSYSSVSIKPDALEEIGLNTLITESLTDLEAAIQEKEAVISIHPLPVVKGDKLQLRQLFQNLIGNAIKYAQAGTPPYIVISSEILKGTETGMEIAPDDLNHSFYLIKVKDNGIGFEQKHAGQIFKVFQRLHGKEEYAGTGVGLAIAEKVIHNHHGYIAAEGEVGKGATFKILLPVL